jgi:hypothetical protein
MEFNSWWAYNKFSDALTYHARYVFNRETQHFLDCVLATSASRSGVLPKGSQLWRAQPHDDPNETISNSVPSPVERMKPIPKVTEGRINPKGIPCLYLATDDNTQ